VVGGELAVLDAADQQWLHPVSATGVLARNWDGERWLLAIGVVIVGALPGVRTLRDEPGYRSSGWACPTAGSCMRPSP
jgi:hypothetical protein